MMREAFKLAILGIFFLGCEYSSAFSPNSSALRIQSRTSKSQTHVPIKDMTTLLEQSKISLPNSNAPLYSSCTSTTSLSAHHNQRLETTTTYRNANILFEQLDELYTQTSIKIKCPFFRRRAADLIDSVAMITRFLLIRHKSLIGIFDPSTTTALPFLGSTRTNTITEHENALLLGAMVPPGCRAFKQNGLVESSWKCAGLKEQEILSVIRTDWTRQKSRISVIEEQDMLEEHDKGYYITGALNSTIYRDDCMFDGPDPDMPVKGLRKYLSAASKLFDHRRSYADLLDLKIIEISNNDDKKYSRHRHASKYRSNKAIEATWEIGGIIMLPWKPEVKPYTGKTIYHLGDDGLIFFHEEKWDISVWEAFMKVLFPEIADKIWNKKNVGITS